MHHRYSGPERMVPFHLTVYGHSNRTRLVEAVVESAQAEEKSVLAVVGEDGTVIGGVEETDEYVNLLPDGERGLVYSAAGPGALISCQLDLDVPNAGILVVPLGPQF